MSKLGDRSKYLTPAVRRAGVEARTARAVAKAADLAPHITDLRENGITSLKGIAAALTERGIPTPAGRRHWHAMQVARVLKRLGGKGAAKLCGGS
jgi:hypothetical protein